MNAVFHHLPTVTLKLQLPSSLEMGSVTVQLTDVMPFTNSSPESDVQLTVNGSGASGVSKSTVVGDSSAGSTTLSSGHPLLKCGPAMMTSLTRR